MEKNRVPGTFVIAGTSGYIWGARVDILIGPLAAKVCH